MALSGSDIRQLRQRLGWSLAEMARQMGCTTAIVQSWENSEQQPDHETLNQLRHLRNHVEAHAEHIAQTPRVETELEMRRLAQITHRDLLKD